MPLTRIDRYFYTCSCCGQDSYLQNGQKMPRDWALLEVRRPDPEPGIERMFTVHLCPGCELHATDHDYAKGEGCEDPKAADELLRADRLLDECGKREASG